jgi:P-type Cu+ transporter
LAIGGKIINNMLDGVNRRQRLLREVTASKFMTIVNLRIKGMNCAACANRIERVMRNNFETIECSVNFATEKATINYSPQDISLESIRETIIKIGFQVESIDPQKIPSIVLIERNEKQDLLELKNKVILAAILNVLLMLAMFPFAPYWFHNPWWQLILTTPILFWCGYSFWLGAWQSLKSFHANMNSLVVLGTGVAYFYSLILTLFPHWLNSSGITIHYYYESAATVITLILLGRFLEKRARRKTSTAMRQLIALQPKTASLIRNREIIEVAIEAIQIDDNILVKSGEIIPIDGIVITGNSLVDEAMVTGESTAINKGSGDEVIGGTINKTGSLQIRATKIGSDTFLARIIQMVERAQASKAEIQRIVDRVISWFVPVVLIIGLITFIIWYAIVQNLSLAIVTTVSVFVIACPCALGLATPTSIVVATGIAARKGILIKDARSLELANKIETIVFDKTGTLTQGKPTVTDFISMLDTSYCDKTWQEIDILAIAAVLESNSTHPLGEAIINYARSQLSTLPQPENIITIQDLSNFQTIAGKGISATITDKKITLGSQTWLEELGIETNKFRDIINAWESDRKTVVCLTIDAQVTAIFGIIDSLKPSALETVRKLQEMGLEVILLTGDNRQTAAAIGERLGIKQIFASVHPEEKATIIEQIQQQKNKLVAMVGDGINDAPALAQADLGIALGTGTDAAIAASDITLISGDLQGIVRAIDLSRATVKNIHQNLFFAFIYNLVAIPIAAGIFYPSFGFLLDPSVAGGAMALSSISVVTNALRLQKQCSIN